MKIGAFIPVRLTSERLPGKALLEIEGKSVIEHLVNRVIQCKYINKDNLVICTTTNVSDDPLAEEASKIEVNVFRGSENDIIDRFYRANLEYGFDLILQVDGDDPLTAPEYMDFCIEKLQQASGTDIVTCVGLPLGVASKAFKKEALEKVWKKHMTEKNDTGFIWYFTKTGLCNNVIITPKNENHINNDIRLTLDYEEDFKVFDHLFGYFKERNDIIRLEEIISFLEDNPQVNAINAGLNERYWTRTLEKAQLEYKDNDGIIRKVVE